MAARGTRLTFLTPQAATPKTPIEAHIRNTMRLCTLLTSWKCNLHHSPSKAPVNRAARRTYSRALAVLMPHSSDAFGVMSGSPMTLPPHFGARSAGGLRIRRAAL